MKHRVEVSNSTGHPIDTILKVDGKQLKAYAIDIEISAVGCYNVTITMPNVELDLDCLAEDVVIEE